MRLATGRERFCKIGVLKMLELDNGPGDTTKQKALEHSRPKRETLTARLSVSWSGVALIAVLCATSVAMVAFQQPTIATALLAGGVVGFLAKLVGEK